VKAPTHPRFSELQLVLEPARGELVRAFVREASLAEGVPASVASLIADDTAQAWLAICAQGSPLDRARIALMCSHRDVKARISLHGHFRFANIARRSPAASAATPASPAARTESTDGRSAFTVA